MLPILAASVLPAWIALPLGGFTMVVIAAHLISLQSTQMSSRRKRIRHINGVLMMIVTALMTYALGGAEVVTSPAADPRAAGVFLKVWLAIVGLLLLVMGLAVLDVGHTAREALEARGKLRKSLRSQLEREFEAARAAASSNKPESAR